MRHSVCATESGLMSCSNSGEAVTGLYVWEVLVYVPTTIARGS